MKKCLLLTCLCTAACSNAASEAEFAGVYVAHYRGDKATLFINANHTYKQVIELGNGRVLEDTTTWKLYPVTSSPGDPIIEFSNFRLVSSYTGARRTEGNDVRWATQLDRTWFGLGYKQLCFDSDVGYCYVKQSDSLSHTSK
jgi:hypothetical protein